MKTYRDAFIKRLHGNYFSNYQKEGVEYLKGNAKFVGPHTVEVKNETGTKTYTAKHILVSTGGRPQLDTFPGVEFTITSDGFF